MKTWVKLLLLSVISFAIIASGIIVIGSRLSYGMWDPFGIPNRVDYLGRTYYPSILSEVKVNPDLTIKNSADNQQQKYLVPRSVLDCLTGKEFFTTLSFESSKLPAVIYMRINDNNYKSFELSGGP